MILNKLILLGTENLPFLSANKVRMMNIVSLFTVAIVSLYTLKFIVLDSPTIVILINFGFIFSYSLPLLLNKFQAIKEAKITFFCVLMLHLHISTNLYLTNASGFHLYYFLVPTGAFLLFELSESFEKLILSFIAVIMFFYCENTLNTSPLILVSDEVNHIIYQSVIFINMVEVIVVLTIFTIQIDGNEKKLIKQASTDALTDIANRHLFFEKGERLLKKSIIQDRSLSLLTIDIDHFKSINDKYGHACGDVCLVKVSQLILDNCRSTDFVARIGGEEFSVILEETTLHEANNIAEKIRVSIGKKLIEIDDSSSIPCTVSIGISTKITSSDTLKSIIIRSDKALYSAKESGRNRVAVFE